MTRFALLDPDHQRTFSDLTETISGADMALRVAQVKAKLQDMGLIGAQLCVPIDAGLGAVAVVLAAIESGGRTVLVARPLANESPDWPVFCDAVVMPPLPGAPLDQMQILPLTPTRQGASHHAGQILVRSSGTTGTPKWIIQSTAGMIRNSKAAAERLQMTGADRVMVPVSISHSYGICAAFLPAVLVGASIHVVARGNPLTIFQAQRSFEPTVMFLVPSQCRSIMALGRKAGRLRLIVVAGDRLSPPESALFEAAHGHLVNLYGSSEMGVISCAFPDDPMDLRHVTAGALVDGGALAIETDPTPDPSAEGARPMRLVSSNGFDGYADPVTGALMTPAPEIWSTGDLVRLYDAPQGAPDAHPRIEVMGRTDHAVNRDGLLVHVGTIEGCIATARGVSLSAVVAAGQSRRGIGLTAFCTLSRPGLATTDEILAHCRANLAPRAVPDVLHLLAEMPMLQSGKVDRRRLLEMAAELAPSL